MRVVSLVPSWTETLIEAGVEVVGRTRFCIHPSDKVRSISVVGGTKQVEWGKVAELDADLLVLDREENPRSVAEQSPVPWIATHVTSVWDVDTELHRLNEHFAQPEISATADRWRRLGERFSTGPRNPDWLELPGVIEWVRKPSAEVDRFLYLIWRDPWMAVGYETFIGSMLGLLGFGERMAPLSGRYPTISLENFDPERTLLLFSSEPYPFHRRRHIIQTLPFSSAIVDGESYSWFGLRALRFLQECALQYGV